MRLQAELNNLFTSRIFLPENTICVCGGEVFPMSDSVRNARKLIIYVDSTECTTCRISRLWRYYPIWSLAERTQSFQLVILFANVSFETIPISRYLADTKWDIPLYVDKDNLFPHLVPALPADPRLHAFLVSPSGEVLVVGDPGVNSRIRKLVEKEISH